MEERTCAGTPDVLLANWVPQFLAGKYPDTSTKIRPESGTFKRAKQVWHNLQIWLNELKITRASQITREHCMAYPEWRKHPDKTKGKYHCCHNTALYELKYLSMILSEAVLRKHIPANPALRLGFKPEAKKMRPEFSDEELKTITDAIELEQEPYRTMMRNSFLIARWHGVRLNETRVNPMTDVWEQTVDGKSRWMVLFHQKGGREEPKLLHPELIPLFLKLRAEKATRTYPDLPWGNRWTKFFRRIEVRPGVSFADAHPNACFHSLRVTAASRLARANISERKAMEYLTHASTTVHRQYVRWKPGDMEECHHAL